MIFLLAEREGLLPLLRSVKVDDVSQRHQAAEDEPKAFAKLEHLTRTSTAHEAADVLDVTITLPSLESAAQKIEDVAVCVRHGDTKGFPARLSPRNAAALAGVYGDKAHFDILTGVRISIVRLIHARAFRAVLAFADVSERRFVPGFAFVLAGYGIE